MKHIASFILGMVALFASFPAFAQACAPRDALVERLSEVYGEERRAVGLVNGGGVIEMFVSPSGSWTLALTRPDGVACLMAAGSDGSIIAVEEGDPVSCPQALSPRAGNVVDCGGIEILKQDVASLDEGHRARDRLTLGIYSDATHHAAAFRHELTGRGAVHVGASQELNIAVGLDDDLFGLGGCRGYQHGGGEAIWHVNAPTVAPRR